MTTKIVLTGPTEIPAVVEAALGFKPQDSIVVLALSDTLVVRADLDADVPGLIEGLGAAARHWSRVLVALYTDDRVLALNTVGEFMDQYPDLNIALSVRVDAGRVYSNLSNFNEQGIPFEESNAPGRETLESLAATVTSADGALKLAIQAYETGNGGLAWCYLDRYHALGGNPVATDAVTLADKLYRVEAPKKEVS